MILVVKEAGHPRKLLKLVTVIGMGLLMQLTGCATSDATLREGGHSEAYIQGFHDGRHTGMKEAGNFLEHVVKDTRRFQDDADYRAGWLAGEEEGVRMQQQANAASASSYSQKVVRDAQVDPKAVGREAMKDVDADSLKNLEKN